MFNKTTIVEASRTEYVPYEKTVKEIRAPTDDSIRLAKEYEEKIWKDIASRITVDIPSIDAAYVVSEESDYDRSKHIFFKVNGHPVRIKFEYQQEANHLAYIRAIAERITEEVVAILMRKIR